MKGRETTLVVITLRGGMDGLHAVVPHGDPAYAKARPGLALGAPGRSTDSCLPLDGFFGLHPALSALIPLWQRKELAIVHAVGWPGDSRSHFERWDEIESGLPGVAHPSSGWLGRWLAATGSGTGPLEAVAVSRTLPLLLRGHAGATLVPRISSYRLALPESRQRSFRSALGRLYREIPGAAGTGGRSTLAALEKLEDTRTSGVASPETYPESGFGKDLATVGALIRADAGLRVAVVDFGGWDTHLGQGRLNGTMAALLRELGDALAAFMRDVASSGARVIVVAFTEFGRRVEENGCGGTDHGNGSVAFVVGPSVRGGRVLGSWPGLERKPRTDSGDLAVTTDLRDLFAELLEETGPSLRAEVFPGHRRKPVGVMGRQKESSAGAS